MQRNNAGGPYLGHRGTLLRPPKKTVKGKIRSFFWDRDQKACLTRTPLNWLSILIFYFFFLIGVFLIFYFSMKVAEILAALNHNRPQFILGDSPIGSSPGLNFFPMRKSDNLLWLSDSRSYSTYVNKIKAEFARYEKINEKFNKSDFGLCAEAPFGYDKKTPCIFLRINKILMWKPEPYKKGDSLPNNLPQSIKNEISNSSIQRIWVSCKGTTAKDRDHITDDFFEFQGSPGFDTSVYPYDRQEKFIEPLVALMLKDSTRDKIIYSFKCSAWSKNLDPEVSCVEVPYFIE